LICHPEAFDLSSPFFHFVIPSVARDLPKLPIDWIPRYARDDKIKKSDDKIKIGNDKMKKENDKVKMKIEDDKSKIKKTRLKIQYDKTKTGFSLDYVSSA